MKKNTKCALLFIVIMIIFQIPCVIVPYSVTVFNEQNDIRNTYEQKIQERDVILLEFMDCLKSSLNVSEVNANYFSENVQNIMDGRVDGLQVMWKWVKEINPNANYAEVSELFKNMQVLYVEKRDVIISVNKEIFILKKRDANLRTMFPSNIVINCFGNSTPIK